MMQCTMAPAFLDCYTEADDNIAQILKERAAEGGGQCRFLPERLGNCLCGWFKIRIWGILGFLAYSLSGDQGSAGSCGKGWLQAEMFEAHPPQG